MTDSRSQPKNIDPAELWERYLATTDRASPQGAMAFAAAFYTARNAANADHARLANANLKDCLAANASLKARIEELESRERQLVDWAILYASEGQSWVFSSVTEQLIALSARAPTQADAEHFKKHGSLAALHSTTPAVTG